MFSELPFRVHFLPISLPVFISGAVITFMQSTLPLVTSHLSMRKVLSAVILVPRLRVGNKAAYAEYESGSEKRLQRLELLGDNAAQRYQRFLRETACKNFSSGCRIYKRKVS